MAKHTTKLLERLCNVALGWSTCSLPQLRAIELALGYTIEHDFWTDAADELKRDQSIEED